MRRGSCVTRCHCSTIVCASLTCYLRPWIWGGGKCVPKQVELLLGKNYDQDFEKLWKSQSDAPWEGQVTLEMMQEFAQVNEINFYAFHGNRKCVHQTAESDRWLTMFAWDEHAYFAKNSRPYVQTPLYTGIKTQKVEMERDRTYKRKEPELWTGEIKAGIFSRII